MFVRSARASHALSERLRCVLASVNMGRSDVDTDEALAQIDPILEPIDPLLLYDAPTWKDAFLNLVWNVGGPKGVKARTVLAMLVRYANEDGLI
jgi:hypothetical protein